MTWLLWFRFLMLALLLALAGMLAWSAAADRE
jgi:hypothetical protein